MKLAENRFFNVVLIYFSLAGLAAALRLYLFKIVSVNMLFYQTVVNPDCLSFCWCFAAGIPALLFFSKIYSVSVCRKAALSVLPFLTGFLLPSNYFFYPCFITMLGWGVLRMLRVSGGQMLKKYPVMKRETGGNIYPWLLAVAYCLAVWWGFHMQNQAAKAMHICYSDWGTYVESYLNLIRGPASWKDWLSAGSHWNVLVNVLMAGFVSIFPFQEALFLFNSMLIYTAVPLTWILCRKLGLNPFHSFCFALAAAFNPVYGNLSLCLVYGYHPVYFCIPLLLLFFIFRETKHRTGMVICLIATLMVKETMMIFWFGYGIWLLCRRKWLWGGILSVGCLFGFWLLSSIVLPGLVNTSEYPLTFLYSSLGDTPLEVVKSPVTKPQVFWKIAFQWQNFAYLMTLLVPCFFCVWLFPDQMIAVLPLLAGICLRGTPEIKSITLQYGTETATLLLALAAVNFNRIRLHGGNLWCRILFSGLDRRKCPRSVLLNAFAIVTFMTSGVAHYCFAQSNWGKYSFSSIDAMPDMTPVIQRMKEKIPAGAKVLATERLRNHFMYRHPTGSFSTRGTGKPGDYYALALCDYLMVDLNLLESLRRRIASDPRIIPVLSASSGNKHFVVFKVTDGKEKSDAPRLQIVSPGEFARIGSPVPSGNPDFAVRALYNQDRYVVLVRIEKVPDYDVDLWLELDDSKEKSRAVQPFGWGLYPAYSCPQGTVFMWEKPSAPAVSVKFRIEERKNSRFQR